METRDILRQLREKHNLTQDQMAERAMVTRQAVSRWENGETQPNTDTLRILSKELGNGYLVSWCVGHLLELSAPERYDERFAKWRQEDLPILSEKWLYEVFPGTRRQHQILKSLMERSDLESLVCATDAGREGELIFRLVYNQCRCEKPFERLWISSMEDAHAEHLTG